jgi:hypothetical protein
MGRPACTAISPLVSSTLFIRDVLCVIRSLCSSVLQDASSAESDGRVHQTSPEAHAPRSGMPAGALHFTFSMTAGSTLVGMEPFT